MLSVYLSKGRDGKWLTLCVQDKGLICTDSYSLENKKLLKKNKKMNYMKFNKKVVVCWQKAVQQERRGDIVKGRNHHTASEHPPKGRYSAACVHTSEQGKMVKLLPREYVV